MGQTIVGSLLPVVVTLLLGFVAARRHDFSKQHAAILNRLALRYALPLMLLVGTVKTSRAELREARPLLIALFVAIVGLYAIVFLLSRFAFAVSSSTSALAALTAATPAVPFMGPAILGYLSDGRARSRSRPRASSSTSRSCLRRFSSSPWIPNRRVPTERTPPPTTQKTTWRARRDFRQCWANLEKRFASRWCGRQLSVSRSC